MRTLLALILVLLTPGVVAAQQAEPGPEAYRADALSIEALVNSQYAYLDRFPGGVMPMSAQMRREAEAVSDRASLLRYAEHAVTALADHHAITGASFGDSWGLVPSYSDLWIETEADRWRITAVRDRSPAAEAGVAAGDELVAVGGVSTAEAVAAFWAELGLTPEGDRAGYGARVLAAGRRDRPRDLAIRGGDGVERRLTLPNLYGGGWGDRPPVTVSEQDGTLVIRINDSLGDSETVAAFDAAMAGAKPDQLVVIDLRDTASGGNTVVARAIMGWFVDEARPYQIHNLPSEERETGVPRQWIEQVLPRPGKRHRGPVMAKVGRWTGSMGEGLAVGLDAVGVLVVGEPMAGLLGAVYDHPLANSGLVLKLPTERLYAVDGTPREAFRPRQ
ncbi:carboxyl-terminal processing protease [Brevundimonas alba]|uniref:Carboxyl-terminal processing protease n=1 Tax=Brevundimonas alba TaxID=74314 RepID=A0A7X6BPG3_9CAUL|nr:PDZ domain-containing protein [Brevundimonas alba]NJC42427.1 carboxyl-terminal processing protease [Brevundimonas alba]